MEDFSAYQSQFFVSPYVRLCPRKEGNAVLYTGHDMDDEGYASFLGDGKHPEQLAFGGRAGPWENVNHENLAHEMAHFVEIDEPRCAMHGWGLRVPMLRTPWGKDQIPQTYQATLRECRTVAIQANLLHATGIAFEPEDFARSFDFLPDYYNVPKGNTKDYKKVKEYRMRWCVQKIKKVHEATGVFFRGLPNHLVRPHPASSRNVEVQRMEKAGEEGLEGLTEFL